MTEKRPILDPCCGSRMMWFDPNHPEVVFGDIRREVLTVTDRSHGFIDGKRTIHINPDLQMDFRAIPFPDDTFRLVVFDPPHIARTSPTSWIAAKYGKLLPDWRDNLRAGFKECFRVLKEYGVLIFKWSEVEIKTSEVLELTPYKPLFGHRSGKKAGTHWIVFMKLPAGGGDAA